MAGLTTMTCVVLDKPVPPGELPTSATWSMVASSRSSTPGVAVSYAGTTEFHVPGCPPMIRFACSRCGKQFRKDDALAGRRGRCGGCGYVFRVPGVKLGPADTFVPIVVEGDLRLVPRRGKAGLGAGIAIAAALLAGGLLLALPLGFRDAIVARVAVLAPAVGNPELNRKIYECYKTRSMRTDPDGVLYFEAPTRIAILEVERREKGHPRNEGTPYYVKVWVRFEDGTSRENDEWGFFVNDDKSVWYTPWGSLAWSNFLLDASEGKLPPLKAIRPVRP